MYAAVLFIGVLNGQSVQPVVSVERTVFYRERAAGMYSALPYAFGQVHSSHINSTMPDTALPAGYRIAEKPDSYQLLPCRLPLNSRTHLFSLSYIAS
jgi:hypothetical protein